MGHRDDLLEWYATLPANTQFVRPSDVVQLVCSRPLPQQARIIDVGCGQGQAAIALAQAVPDADIWGFDLSPQQIDHAQRNAQHAQVRNVRFVASDWRDFSLPNNAIDVIVCTQVIQFVDDEHALVEYMMQGLAQNGQLLIRTAFLPEDEPQRSFVERIFKQWLQYSVRFYSERDLTELMRDVGLRHFRIDKEEMWLDALPPERERVLQHELRQHGYSRDDVQPWFWAGTISAVK